MAGAHCTTCTSAVSFVGASPFRKALVLCSIPTPSHVKFLRRRNYLRHKILKTITKNPITPSTPIESQNVPQIPESQEIKTRPYESEEVAVPLAGKYQIEDYSENGSGSVVVSNELNKVEEFDGKMMLKLGLSLAGIFVVQTVVAVWIGLSNSAYKIGKRLEGEEADRSVLQNGSPVGRKLGFNDEAELEKKIVEIRAMARDARRSEKMKESSEDKELNGVEKEVSARLGKLEKKLSSKQLEGVSSSVSSLGKSSEKKGVDKESDLSPIEGNGALMFKKKQRFRSSGVDKPRNSPKGFTGSGYDVSAVNYSSPVASKVGNGSRNMGTMIKSDKDTSQRSNSMQREVGRQPVAGKLSNQQLDKKNELWWLKLPYVLGILMHQISNPEEPGGLYTLRNEANDQVHSIAFEDRGDANNFCYILETFFEDLGDFSVDIVPLPVKDLLEEAKSHTMKWIVVRKGQLQLYAGQALDEVETNLRSLAK